MGYCCKINNADSQAFFPFTENTMAAVCSCLADLGRIFYPLRFRERVVFIQFNTAKAIIPQTGFQPWADCVDGDY